MDLSFFNRFSRRSQRKKDVNRPSEPRDDIKLEKSDFPAMLIAAFVTIAPVIVLIAALVFGLMWLLFGR